MFQQQRPHSDADTELREILRRGESRVGRPSTERPSAGRTITLFAWLALLVLAAWILIQLGIVDPNLCHGTLNPASC